MLNNIQLRYKGEVIEDYHVNENGFVISPNGNYITVSHDGNMWVRKDGIRKRISYNRALMDSYGKIAKHPSHVSVAFKDGNEKNRTMDNMYWIPFTAFKPFEENCINLPKDNQIDISNWMIKTNLDFSIVNNNVRKEVDHWYATLEENKFDGGYPESVWNDMKEDGWRFIPPHDIIDEYLYRRAMQNKTNYSADKLKKYHYIGCSAEDTIFNVFGHTDIFIVENVVSTCIDVLEEEILERINLYNRLYDASFYFRKFNKGGEKEYLQHLLKKDRELDRRFTEAVRSKSRIYQTAY